VHRDLKPGNLLFNETWHLVLADFGTAKEIEPNQGSIVGGNSESNSKSFSSTTTRNSSANNLVKSNVSAMSDNSSNAPKENIDDLFTSKPDFSQEEPQQRGSFVGTADYIAPEIINSQPSSFSSDLWSLGVIIYQLFTGKTPFKQNAN
jgi:serine/threonine protein kinase